jgi:hypothetical protein
VHCVSGNWEGPEGNVLRQKKGERGHASHPTWALQQRKLPTASTLQSANTRWNAEVWNTTHAEVLKTTRGSVEHHHRGSMNTTRKCVTSPPGLHHAQTVPTTANCIADSLNRPHKCAHHNTQKCDAADIPTFNSAQTADNRQLHR